jgi:hypothetical protein
MATFEIRCFFKDLAYPCTNALERTKAGRQRASQGALRRTLSAGWSGSNRKAGGCEAHCGGAEKAASVVIQWRDHRSISSKDRKGRLAWPQGRRAAEASVRPD